MFASTSDYIYIWPVTSPSALCSLSLPLPFGALSLSGPNQHRSLIGHPAVAWLSLSLNRIGTVLRFACLSIASQLLPPAASSVQNNVERVKAWRQLAPEAER